MPAIHEHRMRIVFPSDSRRSLVLLARLVASVALLAGFGCTLPDVSPFQTASHGIYETTARIGQVFDRDVEGIVFDGAHAIKPSPGSPSGRTGELKNLFTEVWAPHVEATHAMALYADALVELAESPARASEKVGHLAKSVSDIFGTVSGHALPNGITEIAQKITQGIAAWKASSAMHEAVSQLHPDIERFGTTLNSSYSLVDTFLENIHEQLRTLELSDKDRKTKIDRISSHKSSISDFRKKKLEELSADETAKFHLALAELEALEQERYKSKYQRARRSVAELRVLVKATQAAITEWVSAHGKIKAALENDRSLSAPRLLQKAVELKELYKDIRATVKDPNHDPND